MGLTTRLPSLAMNWKGTAVQFQDSASLMKRDMQALSRRKRYLRGSTSMKGAYCALTHKTSPTKPSVVKMSKYN
jgi:hypothetical protein